ncbi:MAG: cation:proton antiporter [Patescibacteria group bacterium]
MHRILRQLLAIVVGVVVTAIVSHFAPSLFDWIHHSSDAHLLMTFLSIAVVCVLSFAAFHFSEGTPLPSFVAAIFFGIAGRELLTPITHEHGTLAAIVGFGATLILFSGGLETPFASFRKLLVKILSLSFFGLFLTAFLFSWSLFEIGLWVGISVPVTVAVLLGAVLASTDPAAIIPVLKQLRFKNRETKDIIISESAVTDVTGTLLTLVFLGVIGAAGAFTSINSGYGTLFTAATGWILLEQIAFGVLFGVMGYGLLVGLTRFKSYHAQEYEADAAFFVGVPVIIFTIAVALGGSGYLAAFIAGLLYVITKHLHTTERFFNHMIEGFLKPTIFILLGALVDVQSLLDTAVVGILAGLVFMGIIRPLTVFLTLGPFSFFGKDRFSIRELWFISFVRETGAIPAVLLVTIVSSGITGLDNLVPIGMWVILLTLVIQPALTPLVARWLKVAVPMADAAAIQLHNIEKPMVVLGSRGHSYVDRLPRVVAWALRHNIDHVMLLHCLEDQYTTQREAAMRAETESAFKKINAAQAEKGEPEIEFHYVSRTGFLQQNIAALAAEHESVSAIFVGRKILDFRLEEIKQLQVPLFFID